MDRILTLEQLIKELDRYDYKELHVHHTYKPDHSNFTGSNHMTLQANMRKYHINNNGWADIAQHVSLFPDGKFVTGRNFGSTPASIQGYNTGAFCVEMIGNFDKGNDVLEGKQLDAIVGLAKYFDVQNRYIRFHRENSTKTCPGTSIDKVAFMKLVQAKPVVKKLPVVKLGDKGDDVKLLQNLLNKNGFRISIDGDFGKMTYNAVLSFQRANHLVADGIVGANTWTALNK